MLNVLYIGPNDSEWAQYNRPVSLAAAKWARGFLTALSKVANVVALTHTYEIAWPKGKKIWCGCDKKLYNSGWDCVSISYPVIKGVRELWLRYYYSRKAVEIIRERSTDVVLFYNCDEWLTNVIAFIRKSEPNVKIIPIILDGNDPRKDEWKWIKKVACHSDGFVSLSWWIHCNIPSHVGRPSYHFDGGADRWNGGEKWESGGTNEKRLVHTGALDQWRGLGFMINVVKTLTARRRDVKFIFCGKSSSKTLEKVFGVNPQVDLPGVVPEEEMTRICNTADLLLNVRDPNHPDNILNYPSKLPHYLSFGRPIVSTRLLSLSPDYDAVIHFPIDNSVDAYVGEVEKVLALTDSEKCLEFNKIHEWFNKHKKWDVLIRGLTDWLEIQRRKTI